MVVGIVLGHLYDTGVFSRGGAGGQAGEPGEPAPSTASNPYGVLGVSESSSDDDVEAAYRRLMSEFHPDRVAAAGPEIRELAERRTREANAAYDQIKRQRGR